MNKPTIIRKIDDLGRIVLPIDVRKKLHIMPGDSLEMNLNEDNIQIKKTASIYNLIWLAKIIIKNLYEIYKLESALVENDNILISTQKEKIEEYVIPITIGNKEIGNYIIYGYLEKDKQLIDFVVLTFKKYLEEQE